MRTDDDGHVRTAVSALAERRYEQAGDAFTRAAWHVLAEPRADASPFDADEKGWVGDGLRWLALAAAAYRVADRSERASHRAVEGVAVAQDLQSVLTAPVQVACLAEFVADFRVLGGLDGVEAAYDEAATAYEEAAATVAAVAEWTTTPLLQAATEVIAQLARGPARGEIAVSWTDLHGPDPSEPTAFLGHRVAYKRQRLPSLVAQIVADGHLAAPRGTTEYDNATYRCPACGARDVNWIADNVVCLRCSTPMDETGD